MLETLDAAAVRRWCNGGLEALRAHQREIDDLNVYPVPDGDTGTNLVLTLTAAHEAVAGPLEPEPGPEGMTAVARLMRRMARGALLGARGNSGVIVSQILRGMADAFAAAVAVRGGELARALRTATDAAYAAVARPVEGTVLSVVAAAAEGAGRTRSDDLATVAKAAARAAAEALDRTPQQLPVLARAGVVDAGGRGLCLLLDALVEVVAGETPPAAPDGGRPTVVPDGGRPPAVPDGDRPPAVPDGGRPPVVPDGGRPTVVPDGGRPAVVPDGGRPAVVPDGDRPAVVPDGEMPLASARSGTQPMAAGGPAVPGSGSGGPADADPAAGTTPITPIGGPAATTVLPISGQPADRATPGRVGEGQAVWRGEDRADLSHPAGHEDECAGYGFEVQYLLEATEEAVTRLRGTLDGLGDSLVVVGTGDGDPPTWNVHVHVTDVGPAIEAGIEAGRPFRIRVTPLVGHRPGPERRAAVVVAAGDGLTALFVGEGATVVDRNPSTAELLAAVHKTGAGSVVLLPNDANTQAVAVSAAREAEAAGIRVSVVPTRSPVQALAALAVRDEQRLFADDVIAMAEAAGACRYGEVCTAQRDALTVAGPCRAGDLLGLVDGEVHVIGGDLTDVSHRLLDRMLGGGGELVTLVLGAAAPPGLEADLRGHVHRTWPFIELQCYAGGQPRYHLLAGVE
ncbi:DAK2 domain-containing protein [Actinoplanes hulinensis]|uniref:DAK2 domain-containing protein n=1 Tax=Actinoplanes hulinensis TaxID=1144547 RepID=UPI0027E34219|nr:DAK2 domain-containing protein [Actinoplanes hulinensis]